MDWKISVWICAVVVIPMLILKHFSFGFHSISFQWAEFSLITPTLAISGARILDSAIKKAKNFQISSDIWFSLIILTSYFYSLHILIFNPGRHTFFTETGVFLMLICLNRSRTV